MAEYSDEPQILPAYPTGFGSADAPRDQTPFDEADVGEFRQGGSDVRWALARYLVGRVIITRISIGLLFTVALIATLGALAWWAGIRWLGVLILLFALGVAVLRWIFVTTARRLTAAAQFGPAEDQVRKLIGATGGDLRRELRRIGVPSHWWSFPLLLMRLMRRKSRRTIFTRLRSVELDRIVPSSRLDELHMIIDAARRG